MSIGRDGQDRETPYLGGETPLPALGKDAMVEVALAQIPPLDAEVLRLRFGIGGLPQRSAAEVSVILGIPLDRLRQIELGALRALRTPGPLRPLRIVRPQ